MNVSEVSLHCGPRQYLDASSLLLARCVGHGKPCGSYKIMTFNVHIDSNESESLPSNYYFLLYLLTSE